MIDEPKGFHYLAPVSGIRLIQAPLEVCDIDCLISTVRRDSRSVLLRFLHFAGCPQDRYLKNKVSLPISWTFELNCLTAVSQHHGDIQKALNILLQGEYTCTVKYVTDWAAEQISRYNSEGILSFKLNLKKE